MVSKSISGISYSHIIRKSVATSFSGELSMILSLSSSPALLPSFPLPKAKILSCTMSSSRNPSKCCCSLLKIQRNKIGGAVTSRPLISINCDELSCRAILTVDEAESAKQPPKWTAALSFGALSWLVPAQVAYCGNDLKINAVYEIGELFELGIQLSYLLLLLALLGVGSFFVIRQVLLRRELDLSAKELQEQVRSGDATATEYFELGAVMLRRKFYPAATKYLLQAIEKWDGDDQDLAQVYNALGVSYVRDGKLEKGIAQFENAVKLQPGYVTAWNNLGDAYEKKKDLKSALKAFEEVLLFDPNNTIARPRVESLRERVTMLKGVPLKSKKR